MSERTITHEVGSSLGIESYDQAVNRLKADLEFVPASSGQEPDLTYLGQKAGEQWSWAAVRSDYKPEGVIAVDPADAEDRKIFDLAAERARANDNVIHGFAREEGRWWLGGKAERPVEESLLEAFAVSEGENTLDVLNCTDEKLTETEQKSIEKVFNHVANFTGNKIFSRVEGIVLAGNKDGFKDDAAGDYQAFAGTIRLNMDVIRQKAELSRYNRYFKEGETNWLEIVLAHELGHAMDIASLGEAKAHYLDTSNTFVFNGRTNDHSAAEKFDRWTATTLTEEGSCFTTTKWDYKMLKADEQAATDYAKTSPSEDFAEAFAIAALNGDMSRLLERQKMLAQTMLHADGESMIGPKKVAVEPLQHENQLLKKINRATMQVVVL